MRSCMSTKATFPKAVNGFVRRGVSTTRSKGQTQTDIQKTSKRTNKQNMEWGRLNLN